MPEVYPGAGFIFEYVKKATGHTDEERMKTAPF